MTSPYPFANWSYPTAIRFGVGRIAELPDCIADAGIKKPLIVTDRGLSRLPMITDIMEHLRISGYKPALFSEVDANPDENNLAAGISKYLSGEHDAVVAVGGGSGLDIGKAVAFMAGQNRPIWDFEDIGDHWKRANIDAIAPIIAVPTTAGTGSEVGRACVITNSKIKQKKIIFHPQILPQMVIADPKLCISMPSQITAGTGMDAFAHCLEAFSSPHFHPMSQGIALEGMRLVKENLLTAYQQPEDLMARSQMQAASLMGATAFQKGLGAVHALSHSIGVHYNIHHGTINAVCLVPVLHFNRQAIEKKIDQAASYLGISDGFDGFVRFITNFIEALDIPPNLSKMGVDGDQLDKLVDIALCDPSVEGNPVKMTPKNTKALIEQCL